MPVGTALECNGARLELQGDFDGIRLGRMSRLEQPLVDARHVSGFDSVLVRVTDEIGGFAAMYNPVVVRDMHVAAPIGQGRGFVIEDRLGSGHGATRASGIVCGTDVGIHYDASGEDAWINSCHFEGFMTGARVAIRTERSPDAMAVNDHKSPPPGTHRISRRGLSGGSARTPRA